MRQKREVIRGQTDRRIPIVKGEAELSFTHGLAGSIFQIVYRETFTMQMKGK